MTCSPTVSLFLLRSVLSGYWSTVVCLILEDVWVMFCCADNSSVLHHGT